MIDCLRGFSVVKTRAAAHLVALGPDSMMLHYVTINLSCHSIDFIGMLRTDCSGETQLTLQLPSSS